MSAALEGFTVLDLSQGVCGPFATLRLAEAGATVLKVEPPGGDPSRQMGPPFIGDDAAVFHALNRNKRTITLDLSTRVDRQTVLDLAGEVDVVVEDLGYRQDGLAGLDHAAVAVTNPGVVWCSISAFGEQGPMRDLPGSELVVQAMAEYTRSLGQIGEEPVRLGADVASLSTGVFASQAVLAALFHRLRSGEGQRVSVSMLGVLLHMRGIMWSSLTDPDDWGGFHLDHYTNAPDTGYRTADGQIFFFLRRANSEDYDRLMLSLGLEAYIADPRFSNLGRDAAPLGIHAEAAKPVWEQGFASLTNREVIELIQSCGGDAVPFMDHREIIAHPQTQALGAIHDVAGTDSTEPFRTVGPVWRMSATPAVRPVSVMSADPANPFA